MKKTILILFTFLLSFSLYSQEKTEFKAKTYASLQGELPFQILMPSNFDRTKKYPLHLFLHGSGEKGTDNQSQLKHGADVFLKMNESYPAIIIFPQCPTNDAWSSREYSRGKNGENIFTFPNKAKPTVALSLVMELMDDMTSHSYVDETRVYVGGLSDGGMGTFELLSHRPNMFAAATPICGGGNPNSIRIWSSKTPVWIFHGAADDVVDASYSQNMVKALNDLGVKAKFSLYPEVKHDSWTNAFAEPQFFPWVYSKTKGQK